MTTHLYPGTNLTKVTSGRRAQVSAVTKTGHAILYWTNPLPNQEETRVKADRILTRPTEWRIHP